MKVRYTATALADLGEIADWLSIHYPAIAPAVERRIRVAVARIGRWPDSARGSAKRPGVRVVAIGRYPYRMFYRVTAFIGKTSTRIFPLRDSSQAAAT
jgi:toxin ParE1/3/4